MGNLFGKKSKNTAAKTAEVSEKDRAILDLKNSRDKLKRYRKKIEKDSFQLQNQARELIRKEQKKRALLVLKLRKYKEKEVDRVDSQLLSVLEMIDSIEWESRNIEVMNALKAGNAALNKLHEEFSVEDVAQLLDETNEAIEVENQINGLLAGQLSTLDDEELLRELDSIMGTGPTEILDLPNVPTHTPIILPPVPTHSIADEQVELVPG